MTKELLHHAEKISIELFDTVEKSGLIMPGKSESQLSEEICTLASQNFGIGKFWHKKIVRAGKNTLCIYPENPPDTIIQNDDVVILDFGPIVDGYEGDVGRTYVIGKDQQKLKLKNDLEKAWYETKDWYWGHTSLKSSELFQYTVDIATRYGYTFGGEIAGHIVGKFPHEQSSDPKSLELDIHPDNHNDMFLLDANGLERHWILELHFVDKRTQIGGFFEQLL